MQLNIFSLLGDSVKKICVEFKQSHILNSLLKEFQNADSDIMKKNNTQVTYCDTLGLKFAMFKEPYF